MAVLPRAGVELNPARVEVKRNRVRTKHLREDLLELIELDLAVSVGVKDAESDLQNR